MLGPALFAIIISSLKLTYPNCTFIKFADDVTVANYSRRGEIDNLDKEWETVQKWSQTNDLPINMEKTKIIDISTVKNLPIVPLLCCNGTEIKSVKDAVLLGVIFQANMKWDIHVKILVSRANKAVFPIVLLKRIGCSDEKLWVLYSAFVRSILSYGCSATCNMSQSLLSSLARVEKRFK